MSSTYGDNLKLSIFGQSHGPAVGMTLDGIPAGLPVDFTRLQEFLNRRAPGRQEWATPRAEADKPEFLGGIHDGFTCGAPIAAVIYNNNTHASDYDELKYRPRPGHADYTAQIKYGGFQDHRGGGHFSGRLTAPMCIAGGLCKQWLEDMGIRIGAHIVQIGMMDGEYFSLLNPQIDQIGVIFPTLSSESAQIMQQTIEKARQEGESVGGIIECAVIGLPAGLGEPIFGAVESKIAQIVYGIPAVKALEFGQGNSFAVACGSMANDAYTLVNGKIRTTTNHSGGILGGITNGMPLVFNVTIKPTPSISKSQQTVDLRTMQETQLRVQGRHDPCIVPRAVPVVEAAAAIALFDLILGNTQTHRKKEL